MAYHFIIIIIMCEYKHINIYLCSMYISLIHCTHLERTSSFSYLLLCSHTRIAWMCASYVIIVIIIIIIIVVVIVVAAATPHTYVCMEHNPFGWKIFNGQRTAKRYDGGSISASTTYTNRMYINAMYVCYKCNSYVLSACHPADSLAQRHEHSVFTLHRRWRCHSFVCASTHYNTCSLNVDCVERPSQYQLNGPVSILKLYIHIHILRELNFSSLHHQKILHRNYY